MKFQPKIGHDPRINIMDADCLAPISLFDMDLLSDTSNCRLRIGTGITVTFSR